MFPHLKRWIKKKKTQAVAWQSRKSTIVRILFFFFFCGACNNGTEVVVITLNVLLQRCTAFCCLLLSICDAEQNKPKK